MAALFLAKWREQLRGTYRWARVNFAITAMARQEAIERNGHNLDTGGPTVPQPINRDLYFALHENVAQSMFMNSCPCRTCHRSCKEVLS